MADSQTILDAAGFLIPQFREQDDETFRDALGPRQVERYQRLEDTVDELAARYDVAREREFDSRKTLFEAESKVRAMRSRLAGTRRPEGVSEFPEITQGEAAVQRRKAELQRFSGTVSAVAGPLQNCRRLSTSVRDFVLDVLRTGGRLVDVESLTVKLGRGEDGPAALERVRKRRADLLAEAARTRVRPIPLAQAIALATAEIDELARKGEPDASAVFERAGKIHWPAVFVDGSRGLYPRGGSAPPSVFEFTIWLNRDEILARLIEQMRGDLDETQSISDADRAAELARLDAEALAAEREEVALVFDVIGDLSLLRGDTSPQALLAVEVLDAGA